MANQKFTSPINQSDLDKLLNTALRDTYFTNTTIETKRKERYQTMIKPLDECPRGYFHRLVTDRHSVRYSSGYDSLICKACRRAYPIDYIVAEYENLVNILELMSGGIPEAIAMGAQSLNVSPKTIGDIQEMLDKIYQIVKATSNATIQCRDDIKNLEERTENTAQNSMLIELVRDMAKN